MERTDKELQILLNRIIGKTPLSVIQEVTGLPKATASRLLNGQFKGRASASALWKLTNGNSNNSGNISFSDVMTAAGYTDAEVRRYELKFMSSDDKLSNWEKRTLFYIQSRLSERGVTFGTSSVNYNGLHASVLSADLGEFTEWVLVFVDVDDIDSEGCFNLFGRIALYPYRRGRKTSIVMRTDRIKEYAYNTSLAGLLSLIVTDFKGIVQDEVYLNDDGEKALLIL